MATIIQVRSGEAEGLDLHQRGDREQCVQGRQQRRGVRHQVVTTRTLLGDRVDLRSNKEV